MEIVLVTNGNIVKTWKVTSDKESEYILSTPEGQQKLIEEIKNSAFWTEKAEEKIRGMKWI